MHYINTILKYSNKIKELIPKEERKYIEKIKKGDEETMKFEKLLIELLEDKANKANKARKEGERIGEQRGEKRGERRGEKAGIAKIVKRMLSKNIDEKTIMELTGVNKQELEKLKIA